MPYIGKPQSADPITVNTSNIDDGTIQAVDISSSFREHISGSFQGGGSNKISGSLTSTGSFGKVEVGSGKITTTGNMVLDADGAQIRLEDGGTEFGRISRVSSDLVIKSISNNNDILFKGVDGSSTITALQLDMSEAGNAIFNNDVTIAGTLTAQEIHTEFTSASILFTSGSTIFGNSSDDVHNMTGSLNISGSLFVKDGTLTVTDNVDFNGDLDVDGTTNLDVVDIDGAVDMASTLKAGDTILGQTGNQKGKLTIQSRTGAATRKTNAIVAVPYNDTSESICMIGMDGQSSNNEMHIGSNTSDFMSPTFIDFFTASDVNSQTNNRVMRITSAGDVGIGTDSPDGKLHIHDGSAGSVTANGDAANLVIESSATGADTGLSILSKNTRANQIFFGDEDDNDIGAIGYVHNGNYMFFRTNTSEQVRIDSSGNVGIANTLGESTLSDYTHLFIGGTGTVISNATEADGNQMYVGNNVYIDSTTGAFQRQRNDEATLYKSINGTHLFQVAGTGTPDADITFTDALIIDNSGKVGIGTDSPDAGLDLRDTMKLQTNTVPASLIAGTNDTTDHTGENTALAIDFRNLSTTNGVASGIVGLDKDGLELSKILLVTDSHDSNTSSIRFYTSTNASQRSEKLAIQSDGGIIQTRGKYARFSGNWEILDVVSRNSDSNDIQSSNCFADNRYGYFKIVIPYIRATTDGADLQLTFLYNSGGGLTEQTNDYYGHKQTMGHNSSGYGGATYSNSSQMTLFTDSWNATAGGIQGELYIYNTIYHDTSNFDTSIFSSHEYTGNGDRGSYYRPIGRGELLGYNQGGTYGYARDSSFFRLNTDRDPDHWKGFRLKFDTGNVAAQSRFIVCGMPL